MAPTHNQTTTSLKRVLRGSTKVWVHLSPFSENAERLDSHSKGTIWFLDCCRPATVDAAELTKCPEWECIVVLLDEMHIREDLVYNKFTGAHYACM